jgi:hypothetical protein
MAPSRLVATGSTAGVGVILDARGVFGAGRLASVGFSVGDLPETALPGQTTTGFKPAGFDAHQQQLDYGSADAPRTLTVDLKSIRIGSSHPLPHDRRCPRFNAVALA